ncbi:MAG: hypothetical protein U9R23_03005 [Candidatus Cloacimonadota bacterium]|nr:hypothetical protein [Candidatus Cloacimonadota bacterium]
MKNEFDILFDIINRFNEINIPYMLTGSLAMNYYAEPRMTRDIDFIIVLQPKMKIGLIQKFKDDYYISEKAFSEAIKYNSMFNIIHKQSVIKADLIIRKNSEYRENEFKRRKKVIIQGHSIYIVSKEDLIISKIFWSRESKSEIQKRDIINLLNDNYDKNYLIEWLKKIELYNFAKEFVGERYFR